MCVIRIMASAEFLSEGVEKFDNLLLRCWVQRGRWLVGNDERWSASDGLCDENTLTLTAAQLMRIGAAKYDWHQRERPRRASWLVFSCGVQSVQIFVGCQNVADLPATWRVGGAKKWVPERSDRCAHHEFFGDRCAEASSRFFPSKRTEPFLIFPLAGRSRSNAEASVLLPDPDSPSTPRISPGLSEKLTPANAGQTSPARAE